MKPGIFPILILGFFNIVIATSGLYYWYFYATTDIVLALISILLAITTYFGFMAISQLLGEGVTSNTGGMRTAITSGILLPYFFILSVSIFTTSSNPLSGLGQSMVNNFTTTISIIIPFYFGTSAYVQTHISRKSKVDNFEEISDQT